MLINQTEIGMNSERRAPLDQRAQLVPLGRRVAVDRLDRQEVVVLQGTRVLPAVPGRRARKEIRAQQEVLAQLEREGVRVLRVPQGLQALLEQGVLRVVPEQLDQPDRREPLPQLPGPPVPQEP